MSQAIPAGLSREHVLKTLSDLDAGIEHNFGKPTGYELVQDEKRYVPKAVIGLACRYSIGRILQPAEFSGGEGPGQANFVLRKLGFKVVNKADNQTEQRTDEAWTENEVRLIVADYFDMLQAELLELPYKKSEHRKILLEQLLGRTEFSIETKHRLISAVLVEHGLPYIESYKPLGNYQNSLVSAVESYLDQNAGFLQKLAHSALLNPGENKRIIIPDLNKIIVGPPEKITPPKPLGKPWLSRKTRLIDFAERDARNKKLGAMAEEFVYDLERFRLKQAGRDDLALKVLWASKEIGDGLGFDILSFDESDESERMLEVKATGLGKFFPFYVTANELRCSEDIPDQFQLFRVFNFGKAPCVFILHGALSKLCQLEPVLYRAVL